MLQFHSIYITDIFKKIEEYNRRRIYSLRRIQTWIKDGMERVHYENERRGIRRFVYINPYAFWGQSSADSIVGQIKEP